MVYPVTSFQLVATPWFHIKQAIMSPFQYLWEFTQIYTCKRCGTHKVARHSVYKQQHDTPLQSMKSKNEPVTSYSLFQFLPLPTGKQFSLSICEASRINIPTFYFHCVILYM